MKIYFLWAITFQRKTTSIFFVLQTKVSERSYLGKAAYPTYNVLLPTSFFFSPSALLLKLVVKFTPLWNQIHHLTVQSALNGGAISIT